VFWAKWFCKKFSRLLFYNGRPRFFPGARVKVRMRAGTTEQAVWCKILPRASNSSLFLSCDCPDTDDSESGHQRELVDALSQRLATCGRFDQPIRLRTGAVCFETRKPVYHLRPFLGCLRRSHLRIDNQDVSVAQSN
jgi:hypothetical protein